MSVPFEISENSLHLPAGREVAVTTGRVQIIVSWGAASHAGHVREQNEDSVLAAPPVFIVADGMGGHDGGEVASALAVYELAALVGRTVPGASVAETVVRQANSVIGRQAVASPNGMGTTVTGVVLAAVVSPADGLVLNVGDSRTYLLRSGVLRQLSTDRSEVQELVDAGLLQPEEAAHHPRRNVVTRALGTAESVEVDVSIVPLEADDRFLVCSDGLTGELDSEALLLVLGLDDPLQAAEALVARTLDGRAGDNITALVLDIIEISEYDDPDRTEPRSEPGAR